MEIIEEENDFSIYDFNSIVNYVKENFIQILLLFFVFCIIYIVDYISNINIILMAPISMMPVDKILTPPLHNIKMPKLRKTSKK